MGLYEKRHLIISFWYGVALIVNQKLKNKVYKPRKGDDRIQILQLATSRNKKLNKSKTEIWIEKDDFKPGIRSKISLKNSVYSLG